jgi:hypothetical protein
MAEREIKQKCFVIMPFSKTSDKHTKEYWTKQYDKFIKPLIEKNHPLIAERSSPLRGDILRQIITDLVTAPIVVADLTDANPNVYWELGVRQSFKHCTITIAEDGTNLPFDQSAKGTLFYSDTHLDMEDFRVQFDAAVDDCLKNPSIPDSHVLETISGRGTLYQILMRDENMRKLDAILSEIERNTRVLESAINTCNENSQKRKEGKENDVKFTTSRFNNSAVENLIVNRYISADEVFYHKAEIYMDWIISFNDQLPTWPDSENATEKWLKDANEKLKSSMNKFKELVLEQKTVIENVS